MAKEVTLTLDDFIETAHKACIKWADENLKDGATVGCGMAMIHTDYVAYLATELFGEKELKIALEKCKDNKKKGSCDNVVAEKKTTPKELEEILKTLAGAKAKVHVIKIKGE